MYLSGERQPPDSWFFPNKLVKSIS
jgi:hypothetical protein